MFSFLRRSTRYQVTLGQHLRISREREGFSEDDAAGLIGLKHRSGISKRENGTIPISLKEAEIFAQKYHDPSILSHAQMTEKRRRRREHRNYDSRNSNCLFAIMGLLLVLSWLFGLDCIYTDPHSLMKCVVGIGENVVLMLVTLGILVLWRNLPPQQKRPPQKICKSHGKE